MNQEFSPPQPKGTSVEVKRAMCHIRIKCFFLAILACLLTMHTPGVQAQTAVGIEQSFSGSLTAVPSENLGVSGVFYIPV
jgi:hypothetical protein